jgi:hypothetical protein
MVYDGTGDVHSFIRSFKCATTMFGWDEAKQCAVIANMLEDKALAAYGTLSNDETMVIKTVFDKLTYMTVVKQLMNI